MEFMTRKLGLDPSIESERNKAKDIFLDKGLIDEETGSSWSQICLMSKSLSTAEFASCLVKDPWTHSKLSSEHVGADIHSHLDHEDVLSSHMQGQSDLERAHTHQEVPLSHHDNHSYYL